MLGNPRPFFGSLLVLAALLVWNMLVPTTLAGPPPGLTIGTDAICQVRKGGHEGYNIFPEFIWQYQATGDLGPEITVAGTYSVQLHNPATDEYETVVMHPYGFVLEPGIAEKRTDALRGRRPHWVFDHVRLEITWRIDSHGLSGSEVGTVACSMSPPPPGVEPIVVSPPQEPEPEEKETFVHVADPSPYSWLVIDSWLLCGPRDSGTGELATWGMWANNNDVGGGEEGVTVSGRGLFYTRTPQGEYTLVQETPFALVLPPGESNGIDGYVQSRQKGAVAAAKLEVEWRASLGRSVDPSAPVYRILRTTGCRK